MALYRLKLFGAFRLSLRDGTEIRITSKKSIALLAMLAAAQDGRRMRPWLQSMLWGARGPEQAQASLRREIANLKKALGAADDLIVVDNAKMEIDLAKVDVDIRGAFSEASCGEFLEGIDLRDADGFNDWLVAERVRLVSPPGEPVRPSAKTAPSQRQWASSRPIRPALSITQFIEQAGDQRSERLLAGATEDVANAFAAYSSFRISTVSAIDPGRCNDPTHSRERLNGSSHEYALTGVAQADEGRISLRLRLSCPVRGHLWQGTFSSAAEGGLEERFRMAEAAAAQIDSAIDRNEHALAGDEPEAKASAWGCYWRASAEFRKWTEAGMASAVALADRAVEMAQNDAWAYSLAAYCRSLICFSGWSASPEETCATALKQIERALSLADDDVLVLGYAAGSFLMLNREQLAANQLIARALALQPQRSSTLFWAGWIDLWNGDPASAELRFQRTFEINPRSWARPFALCGLGFSFLARGDAAAAEPCFREAALFMPENSLNLVGLAGAAMLTGRDAEAHQIMDRVRGTSAAANLRALLPQAATPLIDALAEPAARAAVRSRVNRQRQDSASARRPVMF